MIRAAKDQHLQGDDAVFELSHRLPMAAYHATERWHPERIGALALYCSDGRWGEAFDEFCHRHLQIPRYDRCAMPGGPAWLTGPTNEALVQAARAQLDFLVKAHELERIVLITHFGCAWYGQKLGRSAEDCLEAQFKDVESAAATLRGWYSGLSVEAYLAMRMNDWLSFHPIEVHGRRRGW
jgi:hypothetical protein